MASTSGEPDLFRLANIGHGYVETVSEFLIKFQRSILALTVLN